MTEQELTALAQILSGEGWRTIAPDPIVTPPAAQKVIRQMSSGYLTLKAERDALKERLEATYVLARSGLGRQLSQVPSEPHAPGQQKVEL